MGVQLTVTQLRNVLQLPERPYEDPYAYDGTAYFDLTHREPCTVLQVAGTASSGARTFVQGVDYQLTYGCIDWTLPGATKPSFGTLFTVDYTYSRLSSYAASTSVANAIMITQQDLGSSYPYGSTTAQGISFDLLATYGASLVAAREACQTLQTSDVDLSQKGRRGSVILDDSKKTEDWAAAAVSWDMKYKRYLTMIRPNGQVRSFSIASLNSDNFIFGYIDRVVFDGLSGGFDSGFSDSGVF